jgi:hypothetical protein
VWQVLKNNPRWSSPKYSTGAGTVGASLPTRSYEYFNTGDAKKTLLEYMYEKDKDGTTRMIREKTGEFVKEYGDWEESDGTIWWNDKYRELSLSDFLSEYDEWGEPAASEAEKLLPFIRLYVAKNPGDADMTLENLILRP